MMFHRDGSVKLARFLGLRRPAKGDRVVKGSMGGGGKRLAMRAEVLASVAAPPVLEETVHVDVGKQRLATPPCGVTRVAL
jgi:hypothetical protein